MYWLKDMLKHIWNYHRPGWAESAIDAWQAIAEADGHPAPRRFSRMLENYKYGILNHCKPPIRTSTIEGVNNKIKVIKRIAYGFPDLEYFALKVKQDFPGNESSN